MKRRFPIVANLLLAMAGGACLSSISLMLEGGVWMSALSYGLGGAATFTFCTALFLARHGLSK